jgi:L-fucose isomerase-like protein
MRKIKAGIVGLGFEGYSFDVVDKITERVFKDLNKTGEFDFVQIPKIQNYEQGQKAINFFKVHDHDCDLVIVIIASWLDARGAMPFFLEFKHLPFLLYSTGGRTQPDGILLSPAGGAGAPGILEPMRSEYLEFEYFFEEPDQETKTAELIKYARGARAVKLLKSKKLGSMGFGDMGLYGINFDNSILRNVYGVQTDFFDMLDVENKIKTLDKSVIEKEKDRLKKDWTVVGQAPKDVSYERIIKIYLSLKEIIKEKKLDAISLKCVEGMMTSMDCAPCMIGTLLGDECLYICENDVVGMLAHVILNSVSGKTSTFVESYEFWKDSILFGVCGFVPCSMIEGQKKLKLFRTSPWEGVMNCSSMQEGKVTILRPFFRNGEPLMHLVTGEAKQARKWLELGFSSPGMHPSIELKIDGSMKHFTDNVPAQHFSLIYGDYSEEIKYLAKILGVECICEN